MIESEIHNHPWWSSRLEHLKEQEPALLKNLWGRNQLKEHLDDLTWRAQELVQKLTKDGLAEDQAKEIVQADVVSPQGSPENQPPLTPEFLRQLDQWVERLAES